MITKNTNLGNYFQKWPYDTEMTLWYRQSGNWDIKKWVIQKWVITKLIRVKSSITND